MPAEWRASQAMPGSIRLCHKDKIPNELIIIIIIINLNGCELQKLIGKVSLSCFISTNISVLTVSSIEQALCD